jgi:hypothetical protein
MWYSTSKIALVIVSIHNTSDDRRIRINNYFLKEGLMGLMAVASCGIFIYLAARVTNVEPKASDEGSDFSTTDYDSIFEQKWLIWIEFFFSLYIILVEAFHFIIAKRK